VSDAAHLRLSHITKRFGETTAVDDVSLDIPKGAFATLLGPSGCGKTTTLRMIAGFYDPDQGDIWLGARRLNDLAPNRRGTAMVFQDYALFPHMTVRGNVSYGLRVLRVKRDDLRSRVDETLAFVGLARHADRYPSQLSGGQQQRVALARALVIRPQVLLLDEPLSNLDAKLREQLRWELRALQRRLGMTFVYVTHDQEEALSMSDWIAVMNEGRVEQAGAPAEVYYRPRTRFVAGFVGSVNLVPAEVLGLKGGPLCIRPETIRISRDGAGAVSGDVKRSAFLGGYRRYWVEAAGYEWIVDHPDPGEAELTGHVELRFDPERAHRIADAEPRPALVEPSGEQARA
jgi:ABC-type Fe3+/spermidine/putrescine transport system ATPase subunit